MGTAFDPTDWQPGVTPYSTSQMNRIEQGIVGAAPVGTLVPFAGPDANVPTGWLVCDGSQVSRSTYDALWDAIEDTWGDGDGATTFDLPDLRGLFPIGAAAGSPVGDTGGSDEHSHTNPDTSGAGGHSHSQTSTGSAGSHAHSNPSTGTAGGHEHSQSNTGSGGSHSHGSAGSHSHSTGSPSSSTLVDTDGADTGVASASHTHSTGSSGSHSHGSGGSHTHSNPITDTNGDHQHSQGNTGTGGSHSHSNPNTASVSNHQHTQAATTATGHLPPWAAVTWLIRY